MTLGKYFLFDDSGFGFAEDVFTFFLLYSVFPLLGESLSAGPEEPALLSFFVILFDVELDVDDPVAGEDAFEVVDRDCDLCLFEVLLLGHGFEAGDVAELVFRLEEEETFVEEDSALVLFFEETPVVGGVVVGG